MTPDARVGAVDFAAPRTIRCAAQLAAEQLSGEVLFADALHPSPWLATIRALHARGRVRRAIGVFVARVWQPWFKASQGCPTCFVRDSRLRSDEPLVVVHVGIKSESFRAAFEELGTVL